MILDGVLTELVINPYTDFLRYKYKECKRLENGLYMKAIDNIEKALAKSFKWVTLAIE